MSYNIYIGNAELHSEWDVDGPWAGWQVNLHAEPNAVTFPFDDMTGNGNRRSPGYSQWSEFCKSTGLHRLFYGVDEDDGRRHGGGILSEHPGCVALTPEMRDEVRVARARWERAHPNAVPGWNYDPNWHSPKEKDDGVTDRDGVLARLIWLDWWMTWALENCERPAISNT